MFNNKKSFSMLIVVFNRRMTPWVIINDDFYVELNNFEHNFIKLVDNV